jgi:hypothetical protein
MLLWEGITLVLLGQENLDTKRDRVPGLLELMFTPLSLLLGLGHVIIFSGFL